MAQFSQSIYLPRFHKINGVKDEVRERKMLTRKIVKSLLSSHMCDWVHIPHFTDQECYDIPAALSSLLRPDQVIIYVQL